MRAGKCEVRAGLLVGPPASVAAKSEECHQVLLNTCERLRCENVLSAEDTEVRSAPTFDTPSPSADFDEGPCGVWRESQWIVFKSVLVVIGVGL